MFKKNNKINGRWYVNPPPNYHPHNTSYSQIYYGECLTSTMKHDFAPGTLVYIEDDYKHQHAVFKLANQTRLFGQERGLAFNTTFSDMYIYFPQASETIACTSLSPINGRMDQAFGTLANFLFFTQALFEMQCNVSKN